MLRIRQYCVLTCLVAWRRVCWINDEIRKENTAVYEPISKIDEHAPKRGMWTTKVEALALKL